MDCSPPGSSVHGISQARILEWVAISFSRGSSRPRDGTYVSCIGRQMLKAFLMNLIFSFNTVGRSHCITHGGSQSLVDSIIDRRAMLTGINTAIIITT